MTTRSLDILVVSDLHYPGVAVASGEAPRRRGDLARILLRKTFWRLHHMGRWPDLVILLGDLLDNGERDGARLADLVAELQHEHSVQVLAVSGNHDGDPAAIVNAFDCPAGLHTIGGYGFLVFHDHYDAEDHCHRSAADLELPAHAAAAHHGAPLIALQHSPLHPDIHSTYPYMPENVQAIRASYAAAGVRLSLSGHYHPGQGWHEHEGTVYCTVPALCETPFRFGLLHLDGDRMTWEDLHLALTAPGLSDCHCHTQFAYCGTDVHIGTNLGLADALGVHRQGVTEHTFQLYYPKDESWSWRWQTDTAMVERAWTSDRHEMDTFIGIAGELRATGTPVGLEVDLLADGRLLLAPADREHFDFIVGAVHSIPDVVPGATGQARTEALFMRDTERLIGNGIDVLAHPFRFFRRGKLGQPTHLFVPVAELLAEHGVAAEINYHTNRPPAAFIEACLERGVRLALGTDSHNLAEVGELWPHLNLLHSVGVRDTDLPGILWHPPAPA